MKPLPVSMPAKECCAVYVAQYPKGCFCFSVLPPSLSLSQISVAGHGNEGISHMFDTDDEGDLINPSMAIQFQIVETGGLKKKTMMGCPAAFIIEL